MKRYLKNFTLIIAIILICRFIASDDSIFYDDKFSKQWYMHNNFSEAGVNMSVLWNETKTVGRCVNVAVIDTGIDYGHEELADKMWTNNDEIPNDNIDNDNNGYVDDIYGWNFVENTSEVLEGEELYENDHGTECAGIIAAAHNGKGIMGVAGGIDVKIMSLKVLSGLERQGSIQNIVRAIQYAENNGAQICNMSIAIYTDSKELREIIESSNMLFVMAAGNDSINLDEINFKQYSDNVIIVGATDKNGVLYEQSNYGQKSVDIVAPGVQIFSTVVDGYDYDTGTSMAAAFVTGACVMVYSYCENVVANQVKSVIMKSCIYNNALSGKIKNGGMLDAELLLINCGIFKNSN